MYKRMILIVIYGGVTLLMGSNCGNKDIDGDGEPDNGECDNLSGIDLGAPEFVPATSGRRTESTDYCVINASIYGYKVWGEAADPSVDDGAGVPSTPPVANTDRVGPCDGETGDDLIVYDIGTPDPDGAAWYASSYETSGGAVDPDSEDMSTFDDCAPGAAGADACTASNACDGTYNALVSRPPDSNICGDYGDLTLKLQTFLVEGRSADGGGRYAKDAECVSGSGRFHLAPFWKYDRNNDGLYSAVFLPLQMSGTGVMTNQASVTAASWVSGTPGKTLRMVRRDRTVSFDLDDALNNPTATGPVISGSHSFNTGIYMGNPYFVVEDLDDLEGDDFQVDLSWTCGAGGEPRDLGQGWQFRPEDVGCGSSYIQKLTLRYFDSPNRVEVQQYGNPNYTIVEPTTTTVDGEAFVFERWGLTVDATLLSWGPTQATVRLDEVSLLGLPICIAGTYTLAPE